MITINKAVATTPQNLAYHAPKIFFMLCAVLACLLTGCQKASEQLEGALSTSDAENPAETLTVLAGSELKDIEPFLDEIQANTGVRLQLQYTGTLDGVNAISAGQEADAAWFSHGKYLSLVNQDKIKAQTQIMLSPVVMGVKKSTAQTLGWLNEDGSQKADITWQTIADASYAGKLKYAMTNPAASNSGFTALMGVTSAFAGASGAATQQDIEKAKPRLQEFFRGQTLTSGSSGWLAESYLKQQNELDAIINYESVLMQMNQAGQLSEPLVLIYPKEGIVTADYPFTLLNVDKKSSYEKVVAYLTSETMQQKLMTQTSRRPVNTSVVLDNSFYQGLLVELPFPNSQKIIDSILIDYANELRNPAYALFLLDMSGSMKGEGVQQLQQAMLGLTGSTDANNRFVKFATDEVVSVQLFNNSVHSARNFVINESSLQKLRQYIESLDPRGGTAIYSALSEGYQTLATVQREQNNKPANGDKPYYYTIVLMTDGKNMDGIDFEEFYQKYQGLPTDAQHIKTFTVLFGDADKAEMQKIADSTGGKVFDGRNGNLAEVFRKIRGYQ